MNAITRRQRILERLQTTGECQVAELAREFGVSQMTVRRDLDLLAHAHQVLRAHGGAASVARVAFDFQFMQRAEERQAAKAAIGLAAAALVQPGQSVLLDSGTTTLAVARALKTRGAGTVITTSLPIASELQYVEALELILLGGTLRRESPDLIGAFTEWNLEQLRADIAFIGAEAVTPDGVVYSASPAVARLLRKMAAAARAVYIVADSAKFGRSALARLGALRDWCGLITDDGLTPAGGARLRRAGARVIVAPGGAASATRGRRLTTRSKA